MGEQKEGEFMPKDNNEMTEQREEDLTNSTNQNDQEFVLEKDLLPLMQPEETFDTWEDSSGRTWTKNVKIRNSGASQGQRDVYIITPADENGSNIKLRSVRELTVYVKERGCYDIDPTIVNFEKPDSILGYDPSLRPRKRHHNTKELIKFIESEGTYVPRYMSRKPNRNKKLGKDPSGLKLTISTKDLKPCHICYWLEPPQNREIIKKKIYCTMCTLKTNLEKLLWYLDDNNDAPPVLPSEFERIMRSTSMSAKEISDFYTDERMKRAQVENPDDFEAYGDSDNASSTSSIPLLDELDQAMEEIHNETPNETENPSTSTLDKGKTPMNGIKRSKNSKVPEPEEGSPEKRIKVEPQEESPLRRIQPQNDVFPEPSPQKQPFVTADADYIDQIKKEIKQEVLEEAQDVLEDDIQDYDELPELDE